MTPEEPGRVVAEASTQQYGYIRCYRAVLHDCGVAAATLYGILEDYAQLGARERRPLAPSYEHLAKLMGVHRNTIPGLVEKLVSAGWVVAEGTAGAPLRYTLPARKLHKKSAGEEAQPAQNLCTSGTESVQEPTQKLCINKTITSQPKQEPSPATHVAGTLPEEKPRKKHVIKADWQPTEAERRYATERGLDPDEQREEFVGHYRGKGVPVLDEHLVWMRWCREEVKRQAQRNGRARPDVNASIVQPSAALEMTEDEAKLQLEELRKRSDEHKRRMSHDADLREAAVAEWLEEESARQDIPARLVIEALGLKPGWEERARQGSTQHWRPEWTPYYERLKAAHPEPEAAPAGA